MNDKMRIQIQQAMTNMKFLNKHPEYKNTYTNGMLTVRIADDFFEHYQILNNLPNRVA